LGLGISGVGVLVACCELAYFVQGPTAHPPHVFLYSIPFRFKR